MGLKLELTPFLIGIPLLHLNDLTMYIYRIRPVGGGVVYVSVQSHADIALRDLGMQIGKSLTFEATDSKPDYLMSKSPVMGGEDADPEFTIEVYEMQGKE